MCRDRRGISQCRLGPARGEREGRGDWWLLSEGKAAHIISYSRLTEELIGDERKG